MVDKWIVETNPSERFPIYTRANVGEVFPDPVAPLTFSIGFDDGSGKLGFAEQGFRDAYVRLGSFEHDEFPDDQCVFLGVNGGYCYLNASAMRLFGERAPGLTAGDIDAMFFGAQPGIPPYEEQPGDVRPDLEAKVGETFGWALTTETLDEVLQDERDMNALRANRPTSVPCQIVSLSTGRWVSQQTHSRTSSASTSTPQCSRRSPRESSRPFARQSAGRPMR